MVPEATGQKHYLQDYGTDDDNEMSEHENVLGEVKLVHVITHRVILLGR